MPNNINYFNNIYRTDTAPWAHTPSSTVEQYVDTLQGSTVLDIGAGDGRNTLYLARQGFTVHALDFATDGLKILMQKARSQNVEKAITPIVADFTSFETDETFDNTISTFTLHFAGENNLIPFLDKAMRLTNPDGVMIVEDFTKNGEGIRNPEDFMDETSFIQHYHNAGWNVRHTRSWQTKRRDMKPDGTQYMSEAIGIVAQKPPL